MARNKLHVLILGMVRLVQILIVTTLLSGCYGQPIEIGSAEPKGGRDLLRELIGQPREAVTDKLGPPSKQFILDDRYFMLYVTTSSRTSFVFPLPPQVSYRFSLGCLMIEIDSKDLLESYKFKNALSRESDIRITCLKRFLSKQELKYVAPETSKSREINPLERLNEHDLISVVTKNDIVVSSIKINSFKMSVYHSDTTKIWGSIITVYGDTDLARENLTDSTVAIRREDIKKLWIWE